MNGTIRISPSLMCADYLNLGAAVHELDALDIHAFHIDVMDGHFVRNFAFNPDMIRAVRSVTKRQLVVHLMCCAPEDYVEVVADAGADVIVFHIEAVH
jgi:ribulose-phosphate 3-epimerase